MNFLGVIAIALVTLALNALKAGYAIYIGLGVLNEIFGIPTATFLQSFVLGICVVLLSSPTRISLK